MSDDAAPPPTPRKPKWRRGQGGRRRKTAQDDIAPVLRQQRREDAWEMRMRGCSYREIAPALGISIRQAQYDFQKAAEEMRDVHADALRTVFVETLDAVLKGHIEAAKDGDVDSAKVVIAVVAEKAKLLAVAAPAQTKVEVTGKDGGPVETKSHHDDILGRLARVAESLATRGSDPNANGSGS